MGKSSESARTELAGTETSSTQAAASWAPAGSRKRTCARPAFSIRKTAVCSVRPSQLKRELNSQLHAQAAGCRAASTAGVRLTGASADANVSPPGSYSKAAKVVHCLRLRWRQENDFKYLRDNYAIDQIIQYGADQETLAGTPVGPV